VAGELSRARRPVDLVNAADLKQKIAAARERMLAAETAMERALQQIQLAPREDKSIVSAALGNALAETKAARVDLIALEKAVADG
jgi:hypothetical protein